METYQDEDDSSLTLCGPFITVVSVDGGIQCGNKLTVITPTEICENSLSSYDSKSISPSSSGSGGDESEVVTGAAYITVLALDQDLDRDEEDGLNNESASLTITTGDLIDYHFAHRKQKSIINISPDGDDEKLFEELFNNSEANLISLSYSSKSNSDSDGEQKSPNGKNSSIVDIFEVEDEEGDEITENVVVYRLPGERLGFGLRFDGGANMTSAPNEIVKQLFIQSCAEGSPAHRVETSWGGLVEGDEILEIEKINVSTMTRIECIQILKDASVAVNLVVRHQLSDEEMKTTKKKLASKVRLSPNSSNEEEEGEEEEDIDEESQELFFNQHNPDASQLVLGENEGIGWKPDRRPPTPLLHHGSKGREVERADSPIQDGACHLLMLSNSAQSTPLAPEDEIVEGTDTKINGNDPHNNVEEMNENKEPIPLAPPRKAKLEKLIVNEEIVNSELEPPLAFADFESMMNQPGPNHHSSHIITIIDPFDAEGETDAIALAIDKIDNALHLAMANGCVDSVPIPLPPQPLLYSNIIEDENYAEGSEGMSQCELWSMCDSDETASTRSTVVSRLSTLSMSVMSDGCWEGEGLINTWLPLGLTVQPTGPFCLPIGKKFGGSLEPLLDQPTLPYSSHEASEIPLAPPLFFQDLREESPPTHPKKIFTLERGNNVVQLRVEMPTGSSPEPLHMGEQNDEEGLEMGQPTGEESHSAEPLATTKEDDSGRESNEGEDLNDSKHQQVILMQNNEFDDEDLALLADELGLGELGDEEEDLALLRFLGTHQLSKGMMLWPAAAVCQPPQDPADSSSASDRKPAPPQPRPEDEEDKEEGGNAKALHDAPNSQTRDLETNEGFSETRETRDDGPNNEIIDGSNGVRAENKRSPFSLPEDEREPPQPDEEEAERSNEKTTALLSLRADLRETVHGEKVIEPIMEKIVVPSNDFVAFNALPTSNITDNLEGPLEKAVDSEARDSIESSSDEGINELETPFLDAASTTDESENERDEKDNEIMDGQQITFVSVATYVITEEADQLVIVGPKELEENWTKVQVDIECSHLEQTDSLVNTGPEVVEEEKEEEGRQFPENYADAGNNFEVDTQNSQPQILNEEAITQGITEGEESEVQQGDGMERIKVHKPEHLHQFIPPPPTFSRLPPDGDEFPNCWSDEKTKYIEPSEKKMFRGEIGLSSPPPLPNSEPPSEEPPPLPSTIPPMIPGSRRGSVDDRKRLFEPPGTTMTNGNGSLGKAPGEPSKKSVKDKIAMFSSRTNSIEDGTDGPALRTSATSSLPRSAGSAFSKSSENLLERNGLSVANGYANGGPRWNVNNSKSTIDLAGRKGSISEIEKPPRAPTSYEVRKSPSYGGEKTLHERSQSMIDVGDEGVNYNYNSKFRYNSTQPMGPMKIMTGVNSANGLMEQRRKCMTKLRGLIIPDVGKSELPKTTSVSVVDLPTIISKDALPPILQKYPAKSPASRTESLDGFLNPSYNTSSYNYNSSSSNLNSNSSSPSSLDEVQSRQSLPSAKQVNGIQGNLPGGDFQRFNNVLPKYSPAFKRRSLTTYQTQNTQVKKTSPMMTYQGIKSVNGEPKSLESLTSPRSDSSFEYSGEKNIEAKLVNGNKVLVNNGNSNLNQQQGNGVCNNNTNGKMNGKGGKMEDSDNDSAVSSSRSSISHGLSPPNSPTPGESSSTPDPELDRPSNPTIHRNECSEENEDNSDEGWRILKAQSVEAINRKNVLTSAKFSSGGGVGGVGSDNAQTRRSDDEEAGYADAEAEDTESSCSELEVSKCRRKNSGPLGSRYGKSADTEEEDESETQTPPSHSVQSSVDLGDLILPELDESPLQAIFDMEAKMAYINEICDALPGSTRTELNSRYFHRRDSEATVIERPIELNLSNMERKNSFDKERKSLGSDRKNSFSSDRKMSTERQPLSVDTPDSTAVPERRARNRSSSGNESDFSSNISSGSMSQGQGTPSPSVPQEERWSVLEKKYSKSSTSLNLLEKKTQETPKPSTAQVVPKIVTNPGDALEKKIERIIEKTIVTSDGTPKTGKVIATNIPRGRNDFKSLSEKWQQISTDGTTTVAGTPPKVAEKPGGMMQYRTSSVSSLHKIDPELNLRTRPGALNRNEEDVNDSRELISPAAKRSAAISAAQAAATDNAWREERRLESSGKENASTQNNSRSVSVNDIRKAFEKAETAVKNYPREEEVVSPSKSITSPMIKSPACGLVPTNGGLAPLPPAHFRVSSFDSTTSEESSATTPAGLYGSVNSLISSAPRDPYGSITSLASSTSLISPQELQQLIDEANQSLEEAGTPSHEVSVVILHREFAGGSLGITLAGGADYETKEITVHKVLTNSIADRDARVHRGDRVLSINGKSTKGLTHREALNLLKAPRTEVVLVVSRGRTAGNGFQTIDESSATLDRAVEPLLSGGSLASLLENDEDSTYKWGPLKTVILHKDGAGLGFSLEGGKGSIMGDKPLTVKKIFVGGPAEKCGELKVGYLIAAINEISMSSKSRTETWNFMKKLGDGEVKISVRSPL